MKEPERIVRHVHEHDPADGCRGCALLGGRGNWNWCNAVDGNADAVLDGPAPAWCPLRTGPVEVARGSASLSKRADDLVSDIGAPVECPACGHMAGHRADCSLLALARALVTMGVRRG